MFNISNNKLSKKIQFSDINFEDIRWFLVFLLLSILCLAYLIFQVKTDKDRLNQLSIQYSRNQKTLKSQEKFREESNAISKKLNDEFFFDWESLLRFMDSLASDAIAVTEITPNRIERSVTITGFGKKIDDVFAFRQSVKQSPFVSKAYLSHTQNSKIDDLDVVEFQLNFTFQPIKE